MGIKLRLQRCVCGGLNSQHVWRGDHHECAHCIGNDEPCTEFRAAPVAAEQRELAERIVTRLERFIDPYDRARGDLLKQELVDIVEAELNRAAAAAPVPEG